MQNLNHFVTYIYSYEQGVKHRNAGFAKIDYRGEVVRMEAQIKTESGQKEDADICLLIKEAERILAIPVAEIRFENGVANYKGRFFAKKIGKSNHHFEEVTGLYIKTKRETFASQWIDEELKVNQIASYKEQKQEKTEPQETETKKKEIPQEQNAQQQNTQQQDRQPENVQAKNRQFEQSRKDSATLQTAEIKEPYDWRYEWEKLDQGADNELVFGLALWTRNKGKS